MFTDIKKGVKKHHPFCSLKMSTNDFFFLFLAESWHTEHCKDWIWIGFGGGVVVVEATSGMLLGMDLIILAMRSGIQVKDKDKCCQSFSVY